MTNVKSCTFQKASCFGILSVCSKKRAKSSSPENELECSEEVEKAVSALNDLNDKEYELSELDIPAARYKVIRSLVKLINTLYPSSEDYS